MEKEDGGPRPEILQVMAAILRRATKFQNERLSFHKRQDVGLSWATAHLRYPAS
jgi:hypothetical protein